jgi:hypothetical protein
MALLPMIVAVDRVCIYAEGQPETSMAKRST